MKKINLYIILLFCSVCLFSSSPNWYQVKMPIDEFENNMGLYCFDSLDCVSFSYSLLKGIFVFKSYDGGNSWEFVSKFEYLDNPDILDEPSHSFYFDSLNFYRVYFDGLVIDKSTDGGLTYETHTFGEISTIEDLGFDNLIMYSKNKGAAISTGYLVLTEDNWETYKVVDVPYKYYFIGPMYFIDSVNIGFANLNVFNEDNEYMTDIIKYSIVEKNWSVYSSIETRRKDEEIPWLIDLQKVNDSTIYGCGFLRSGQADYAFDLVWKSINNGETWESLISQTTTDRFGLSSILFRTENHGIAVGNWGNIIETKDGGKSWFTYPIQKEMASIASDIAWAGTVPIYTSSGKGIFRLETVTDVKELDSSENIRVQQSGNTLHIAINDESYSDYEFSLYDATGKQHRSAVVSSGVGFLYLDVSLAGLGSGVYFYTLRSFEGRVYSGTVVVVG